MPTQEYLKSKYIYDADTGVLTSKRSKRPVGSVTPLGRLRLTVYYGGKKMYIFAHRIIWVLMTGDDIEGMFIDHINGDPLDNRFENLRLVDKAQNSWNTRNRGGSKPELPGAYKCTTSEAWFSTITVRGKAHYLGTFDTAEEASEAYLEAREIHHGGYLPE